MPVLRDGLTPHRIELIPKLWTVLEAAKPERPPPACRRRRPGRYDPESPHWADRRRQAGPGAVAVNPGLPRRLARRPPPRARPAHRPAGRDLSRHGSPRDRAHPGHQHPRRLRRDDPDLLAELLMDRRPKGVPDPLPGRRASNGEGLASCSRPSSPRGPRPPETTARRGWQGPAGRAAGRAAVALVRMGKAEAVWPFLKAQPRPAAPQLHRQLAAAAGC